MESLKKEILELLEKDVEFRYAVAGYLGLSEIMKRLDKLAEEQVKLRKDMITGFRRHDEELAKLREDMNKGFMRNDEEFAKLREEMVTVFKRHDEEIAKLREDMIAGFKRHDEELIKLRKDMNKLREDMVAGFKRHDEEIAKLREDMVAGFRRYDEEIAKLRKDMVEGFKRHDKEIAKLREDMIAGFKRHDEEFAKLREDFNEMLREIRSMDIRLRRVERTLEKLTLDIEEEARGILKYRIKRELGLDMEIGSLILEDLELNLYGVADEVCVVGEASVRAGIGVLRSLLDKVDVLRKRYPERLRKKVIPVIYTSLALPELVDEATKYKVWVLKATGDITKLQV